MSLLAAVIEDLHDWHPEDSAWSASRVGPSGMDLRAVWTANIDAITNMITASAFSLFCVSWFLSISLASSERCHAPNRIISSVGVHSPQQHLFCTELASSSISRGCRCRSRRVLQGFSPTSMLEGGGAQLEEFRKRPLAQNQSSGVHRNPANRQTALQQQRWRAASPQERGVCEAWPVASPVDWLTLGRDEDVPLASPLPAQAPPAHGHVIWLELFEDSSYRL